MLTFLMVKRRSGNSGHSRASCMSPCTCSYTIPYIQGFIWASSDGPCGFRSSLSMQEALTCDQ